MLDLFLYLVCDTVMLFLLSFYVQKFIHFFSKFFSVYILIKCLSFYYAYE